MAKARPHFRIHYDSSLRFILLTIVIIAALLIAFIITKKEVASHGGESVILPSARPEAQKMVE